MARLWLTRRFAGSFSGCVRRQLTLETVARQVTRGQRWDNAWLGGDGGRFRIIHRRHSVWWPMSRRTPASREACPDGSCGTPPTHPCG